MVQKCGLDLTQFHAHAADFDLFVDPAQKLKHAVRPQATEIARAKPPLGRHPDQTLSKPLLG
jgi:hypothetical protein